MEEGIRDRGEERKRRVCRERESCMKNDEEREDRSERREKRGVTEEKKRKVYVEC